MVTMNARIVALWFFSGLAAATALADPAATFTLRDYLRRDWQHELVFFPVDQALFGREGLMLVDGDGKPVAHQWVTAELAPAKRPSIAFFASVPTLGRADYRLVQGRAPKQTDLHVSEERESVRVENCLTGITLGGPEARRRGPIAGVRLRSGRWVGSSELELPIEAESFSVEVLAQGPVFVDVSASYGFGKDQFWEARFRLMAEEPVILVDERFRLPASSAYVLSLADGWTPDEMFHRDFANRCTTTALGAIRDEQVYLLKPWPSWWGEKPEGNWVAFCEKGSDDLVALGCREPGVWVEPGRTDWPTGVPISKPKLDARFQLDGFARKWMLAVLSRNESVSVEQPLSTPLPHKYLIKHGDVPLDRVKDYVLEWDDRATRHPRLFLTSSELERFRRTFQVDDQKLAALRQSKIALYAMDEHVAHFLATGDVELGRNLAGEGMGQLQRAIDELVQQATLHTQGTCPHHRTRPIIWSATTSDLALAPSILSEEERARVKGQLAFLCYTLSSPAFISPERGFSANPNMTTTARGMLGLVACTIPNHPQARHWAQMAVDEIEHELADWCGPGGGWLEAPHYMTVSMDAIVATAMALRESGLTEVEWLYDPRLKKTMAWLAKISTPPDPRLGGDRHMPAIGNTYLGERSCLPGWAARIWRDRDPQFAAGMQWMWKAHGSPKVLGIGGAYPGTEGYRFVMFDESIPAAPPGWTSELFPEAGAVFRAHFPSDRETYMHYVQGKMHQHYDYDEGSFILWGKGQPLCEDFGYYGRAPAADHSRVDDGVREVLGNEGRITQFASGPVDYLQGERIGWVRQILFLEDDDPLGPNFWFLRDTLPEGRDGQWRVWIATDQPPPVDQNPVRAVGRFEAELAVFFSEPARPGVTTESLTRRTGASGFPSGNESTQRSLQVAMPDGRPVAAVLYPLMKAQETPQFTALADGRIVKITSSYGTDYVILSAEPFLFRGEGIEFEGKAGAVQIRPKHVQLSLPCQGTLSFRGQTVVKENDDQRTASRRFGI